MCFDVFCVSNDENKAIQSSIITHNKINSKWTLYFNSLEITPFVPFEIFGYIFTDTALKCVYVKCSKSDTKKSSKLFIKLIMDIALVGDI